MGHIEAVDNLYTDLQRKTLGEIQRLSGKVWTDYNPHDPGVTVADAVNYALTEIDYKFGFSLEDYMAGPDGKWHTGSYGLFPPSEVYTSAPVTAGDYRKLVLANFPMVQNVEVQVDRETCSYCFMLRLSPFFDDNAGIARHVRRFLNRHRNLCENIGRVEVEHPKELYFEAELEISPGYDATEIMVQIFWNAIHYLSGSVQLEMGASANDVRVVIPDQAYTERELYRIFSGIEGILGFKTCCFRDRDGMRITDFRDGYTLVIPDDFRNVKVKMRGEQVYVDGADFKERLHAIYFMRPTMRMRHVMQEEGPVKEAGDSVREARYRDVYGHYPVSGELPACYHAAGKDFGEYLGLFDMMMERGLQELRGLKTVFSIMDADNAVRDRFRVVAGLKKRYMDFLDGLYGTDSAPEWLREFDFYNLTVAERLRKRMTLLRELPGLVRSRSQAMDITGQYGGGNIPVVKRWLSLLLDFNCDEDISVGNVLPGHNLTLVCDRKLANSSMIDDSMFIPDTMEAVEPDEPPKTESENIGRNEELRRHMPIFNSNWISASLFSEGIRLDAYRLVKAGNGEWLLIFQGKHDRLRMNLGRSDDKQRLAGWANTLCRYLRDLNRQCEAVYVVEKSLFEPAGQLSILLVFTGWTARTCSMRFRDACTQLARSVIPSHLKVETCWLDSSQMQRFEDCYRKWHDCLSGRLPEYMKHGLQKMMMDII